MRGNKFLDKMELIDPAYIEAAEVKPQKRKNTWVKWGTMAACLCLVTVSTFMLSGKIKREDEPKIYPEHSLLKPADEDYVGPSLTVNPETCPEPCPELYPENGFVVGGPFNNRDFLNGKPMISNYGEMSAVVDMAVTDGGIYFSQPLQSAMANYDETANYRVLIEFFSDGVQISSGSESAVKEAQRLSDLGYIVAIETYTETEENGEYALAKVSYYFTLHATYEQLKEFPADDNLGYSIMLYDEYFGRTLSYDANLFNGFAQNNN